MYSSLPSFILGFHGTDASIVEAVVRGERKLHHSTNNHDWLGHGAYFWENNPQRALEFAHSLKGNPRSKIEIKTPAVVGAVIDLGYCLNLLDSDKIELVEQANLFYEFGQPAGGLLVENKIPTGSDENILRYRDCAVLEMLHRYRKEKEERPFDSVRGMFGEGEPIYENAGFRRNSHIQICVRNPNCIKGFFLPRKPVSGWTVP